MLVRMGQPPGPSTDVVDAMLDCHEKIRRFVALARKVGDSTDAPPAEIVEACLGVDRYFRDALPLHVRDEEESVLPRLTGRDPAVDLELARMHDEHGEHAPLLAALFEASRAVRESPGNRRVHEELGRVGAVLDAAFSPHLAREETVIFPAIRRLLTGDVLAAIHAELRARRGSPK